MPDPSDAFAAHLQRAQDLFQAGEVVAAGQIWQAILRKDPTHAGARACLIHVKNWLDERQRAGTPVALPQGNQLAPDLEAIPTSGPLKALPPPVAATPAPAPLTPEPPPAPPPAAAAPPPPPPEPEPAAPPRKAWESEEIDIEQWIRQGCTLFDMGQIEDALERWERVLAVEPHHALALEYVASARQELARQAATPPPTPPPAPAPAPPVPAAPQELSVEDAGGEGILEGKLFFLLQEGLTHYDQGDIEGAKAKWREMLNLDPDNEDAKAYLSMAHKDSGAHAAHEEAPSTGSGSYHLGPIVAKPLDANGLEQKCRQAERLMRLGRLEQSIFNFEMVLAQDPAHPRALRGLEQAKGLLADAPPEAESATPDEVTPPASITSAGPATRPGPALPGAVSNLAQDHPWLKSPLVWGGAVALVLLGSVGYYFFHQYQLDQQLASDRRAFAQSALAQASRGSLPPDLQEKPAAIRSEAEQAIGEDPVRAYHRAKELTRLDPGDAAAAQLLERARAALAEGAPAKVTLADFQKHVQQGDLESAEHDLDALLRASPDDAGLIGRASRLYLLMAQLQAAKEHWSEARDALRKGRALNPTDHAWQGRLKLLEKIPSQPKPERSGWISLLG